MQLCAVWCAEIVILKAAALKFVQLVKIFQQGAYASLHCAPNDFNCRSLRRMQHPRNPLATSAELASGSGISSVNHQSKLSLVVAAIVL